MSSKLTPDLFGVTLKIPSKTFLLGEYGALLGEAALLAATGPSFQVRPLKEARLEGIAPESPAGQLWQKEKLPFGLEVVDPHQGAGGFGASGAQFLGAWFFAKAFKSGVWPKLSEWPELLQDYWDFSGGGRLPPSGADMAAQLAGEITFFHREDGLLTSHKWPFKELSFLLFKTPQKISTHEHVSALEPSQIQELGSCSEAALKALQTQDAGSFLSALQEMEQQLQQRGLVAASTAEWVEALKQESATCAAKGCGALGADVIVVFCNPQNEALLRQKAESLGLRFVASQAGLSPGLEFHTSRSRH